MSANLPSFEISARSHPSQGARCIQLPFDFTIVTQIAGDFLLELENGHIDFMQSVKIDNSANPSPFTLRFPGIGTLGDKIVVPPNTQGVYPITVPHGKVSYIGSSVGGVIVPVNFYNIELPYYQASSIAPPSPIPIAAIYVAKSGVVTGADQIIMFANSTAIRRVVQNSPANNNSIFINFGAAATANSNSLEVQPGQSFDTTQGPLYTGDLHLIGTAADNFFAYELHT